MPDIFYIGHSFVSSLSAHLHTFCATPLSPALVASLLLVDKHYDRFHLHGQTGGLITDPDTFCLPLAGLHFHRPEVCLLEYGSNDLAQGMDPLVVASAILDEALTLLRLTSIHRVIVFGILPRISNMEISEVDLRTNAARCNTMLYHLCDVEPCIEFRSHAGFWNVPVTTWSNDGLHPNLIDGRKKIKRSIRFAALEALGQL
jgi:hypothetical protein